jgi:two-component system, NarL family, sensor kinase
MRVKDLIIFIAVIIFFTFSLSELSFGEEFPVINKIAMQQKMESPQLQNDSTYLNKNIHERSDIQETNSWMQNSSLFLMYTLVFIIAFGIVFFRLIDLKHKQFIALKQKEIREQTINELKIDHQLVASRAVLIGEEKERGRISRDLHDGLGGMLSGVKLAISSIRGNNSLPQEIHEKIDMALIQLNLSISELRSIAQNLMPEALINFGLKDALNDFCTNLGTNNPVKISFLFYGEPIRFDPSIENSLFRIAQEAINNALKYSKASQIIVQLIQDESWINLTIQDDGQGFDLDKINEKQSGGLKNIRARAESFDGSFHIDSRAGVGTEVIVDLIYKNNL